MYSKYVWFGTYMLVWYGFASSVLFPVRVRLRVLILICLLLNAPSYMSSSSGRAICFVDWSENNSGRTTQQMGG